MNAPTLFSDSEKDIMIETMVRTVIEGMNNMNRKSRFDESSSTIDTALLSDSDQSGSSSKKKKRIKKKKSSKKKNKAKKTKDKKELRAKIKTLEELLVELENQESLDECSPPIPPTVGSVEFKHEIVRSLGSLSHSLCIQDDQDAGGVIVDAKDKRGDDLDFEAAFGPNDMRCLALVSHNEMKSTMKQFVIQYKHILKKFRLTGTNSTMKMLAEVFSDEPEVVFGPACNSGPLGGDAELVALMTSGQLGGMLFFQDPMTSHPHQCDIECLVRQALVHNTLMANTPATAMACMEVFKTALIGGGRPELIPSFFFNLQSPTVQAYKNNQKKVVNSHSAAK